MDANDKIEKLKDELSPKLLWDRGGYSFHHLSIYLMDSATIEKLKDEKEKATCFVTLVHEYVHYMQNFTTLFGFTNFITYVDLFAAFFVNNMALDHDPKVPLINGEVDLAAGAKTYRNFNRSSYLGVRRDYTGIVFDPTTHPDFEIIESKITDPYFEKECVISYISYQGKLIPINPFIARENMAIIASYLSSGLDAEVAKQSINTKFGPEYHIIFSFIHHLFPDKDAFKLAYIISEIALLLIPFNETFLQILSYFRDNSVELNKLGEDEIIERAKAQLNFDQKFHILIREANKMLDARVATFDKHKKDNGFYSFLIEILLLFRAGLEERVKNPCTFRPIFDSSFLDYFSGIIKSPILIFSDDKKTMLGEQSDEFIQSMAYFSGVLTVFDKVYFREIHVCPFNAPHSLCAHVKGVECSDNPLSIFGKPEYAGCLLDNSLKIIGLRRVNR